MKFYYMNGNKKVYITLKRGAPEWCNLDCPAVYIEGDPNRWPGWTLLSNGLYLEDGNGDLKDKARNFVRISGEAFYSRYPNCRSTPGVNGFLSNFDSHTR